MPHPLVDQLRFTRSEWLRGLRGVSEADGARRFEPMNSIGWIVAHLAWQEQRYWLTRANSLTPHPDLNEIAAFGGPASTPSLPEMLGLWRTVTAAVDPWLDRLGADDLAAPLPGKPAKLVGDSLHRVNYHYWYHAGEIQAIRQMLGHRRLPQFVGSSLETRAAFRGE